MHWFDSGLATTREHESPGRTQRGGGCEPANQVARSVRASCAGSELPAWWHPLGRTRCTETRSAPLSFRRGQRGQRGHRIDTGFARPALSPLTETAGTACFRGSAGRSCTRSWLVSGRSTGGHLQRGCNSHPAPTGGPPGVLAGLIGPAQILRAKCDSNVLGRCRAAGACSQRIGPCPVSGSQVPTVRDTPPGDRSLDTLRS